MNVSLFIPCYIDQFYPEAGIATFELLQKLGCRINYPQNQTCCGQPRSNSGFSHLNAACNKNFIKNFEKSDYIVAPSGSCVLHVKEHLSGNNNIASYDVKRRIFELTEFLVDVLQVTELPAQFPHTVGLHISCHGQRGLHLCSMTEKMEPHFSKPERLLNMVAGIEVKLPERRDECCGFGGTFAVFEDAVSVKMGRDRVSEHLANGVEYITATDTSCLMHIEGILKRLNSPVGVKHIAEILNAG